MRRINLFYIAIVLAGLALLIVLRPSFHREVSFFGFVENRETIINFNYPVVVNQILIKPGQMVEAGDTLLRIARRPAKKPLLDQSYQISTLQAEAEAWQQNRRSEQTELRLQYEDKLASLQQKKETVKAQMAQQEAVVEQLRTVRPDSNAYQPLRRTLADLEAEETRLTEAYQQESKQQVLAQRAGTNPYRRQIERLQVEEDFEESLIDQPAAVIAQQTGLVGNVNCQPGEHLSAFSSLLTLYEPHSGLIKGYIHEDLRLNVQLGDDLIVASLLEELVEYRGTVVGLGSRIVEIPTRLRKVEAIKSYGREVLIEIPRDNRFLQKEKVSVTSAERL